MENDGNGRPKRTRAGVNENLPADFIWPDNFGSNNKTGMTESHPPPSMNSKHTTRKTSSQHSSLLSLQKKRLALENEKKKQELEKKQRQLQSEQIELEGHMRLLNLEEELQKAELEADEYPESVSERSNILPQELNQNNLHDKNKSVSEWVNSIQQEKPRFEKENSAENEKDTKSDIKLLCETITDAIKSVSSPNKSKQDKIMTRHAMEKDFPYFDGNPQDWPLFYRQYKNICNLCEFSDEEIMIKLQRCLKGEAKSTVAGMMLTADNVNLVMQTLETRFGRPEYIIDGLIYQIRGIPLLKDSNFERIIQFSSQVHNMVSIMLTLKSSGHLKNPQLMRDLINKLPDHLKLKWGRKMATTDQELDLEDFSKWLGEVAKAACFVSTPHITNNDKIGHKPAFFKKPDRVLNATEKPPEKCSYCEENIHQNDCPQMVEDDLDKRWKTVTEKKLCFSCLQKNHQKMRCRKKNPCGVDGCRLTHHRMLHKTTASSETNNPETVVQRNMVYATRNGTKKVQLRVVPVNIFGPKGQLQILALCDEASTVTLIDETVANKLGLFGTKETLCLQWTTEDISTQEDSSKIDVKISKPGGNKLFTMIGARTVKNLSLPLQNVKMTDWQRYQHLKNIPIREIVDEKPRILIGQDNIDLIIARQIRCGPENLPVASRCKLGWALHGPVQETLKEETFIAHTLHICETENPDDSLQEMVKNSFSTECFGVLETPTRHSHEISRALKILEETTKPTEDGYETGLLWRHDDTKLPESKFQAVQRLKCVEKKCSRNEFYARKYCEKILEYESKGYIRKLNAEEANIEGSRTWYLPHFFVANPNKKKLRLVFDAASKSHGVSLNDALLAGPDLLQPLVAILWKFRQRKFGFCGDVREMFHQVRIREADRDSQRFLWRNLEHHRPPDVYEMIVMTFGATCSPVCAQYVKNLNAERNASDSIIRDAIIKKFYVDDYLDSKDTEEEALETISEVCKIQKLANFDVVNWMTNSSLVRTSFSEDLLASKNIDDGSSLQRVLGLWWDTNNDEFLFKLNLKEDLENLNPTKRLILKSLMSLYDPLGLLASFTIRGKILMQDIWRSGINWDEQLPDSLFHTWKKFVEDLPKITSFRVSRCYSLMIPTAPKIELHTFCDSSEKAFAAVSYLRVMGKEGEIDISLVASKTRVSPLKPLSIPKLELQAAVLGSRLAQSIKSELEIVIDQLYFWSDSKCVISWIRNDGRNFKQFVAHRVGEIQERTNVEDWRWLPTGLNPADEATRARTDKKIISDQWFAGPSFLRYSEQKWPMEDISEEATESCAECNNEVKRESGQICLVISQYEEHLPDITRFSSWLKLIRSTGWILRFIKNVKKRDFLKSVKQNTRIQIFEELTTAELEEAEKIWISRSQVESFPEEFRCLKMGKEISTNSRIQNLCPEMKNEIMVIGGRTNLAKCLTDETKNPIILDSKHAFTKLLIQHFHEKFRHRGVELVLNEIRQKYWVINGRAAVKKAFSNCLRCKIERAKPVPPLMGQIPEVRLQKEIRPFTNVGMDYFGPIHVKIGRRKEKRWGVIFTCLAVRAIHLEIAHTLDSQSAILSIIRMAARRGQPKTIYCDNGTNMVGASKEIKEAIQDIDKSRIANSMSCKGIDFKFIPPGAPHMGGTWERLIGSVKRVIGKNLHDQSLREETLQTFFAEAEFLINSRPLTRVSSDPLDAEALTPNHFLLGSSSGKDGTLLHLNPDSESLRREWKKSQMLLDTFWKRWVKEYLPTLSRRNKWNKDQSPVKMDDVVVLVDDQSPRYAWKLGRITGLYPGPDGRIRVVDVTTSTRQYRRPVTKICRLELEN